MPEKVQSTASPFPSLEDVLDEPEGLDDLPRFLCHEVNRTLADVARAVKAVAACLVWKDPSERVRYFAGLYEGQPLSNAAAQQFFLHPGGTRFDLHASEGDMPCSSVVIPGVLGEVRLCFLGVPERLPPKALKSALDMARLVMRMVRGARYVTKLRWQTSSSSTVSDMLKSVLEVRPLPETLGVLARKIAEATQSQSVSIDSFPRDGLAAERNLYIDPSWKDWERGQRRWRELLEVRIRAFREPTNVEIKNWRRWRETVVIPDVQHPMVLAANPKEEAEFYVEAGLRTVVLQPLWVGDDFIGLLAISNRVVRSYSSAELGLISSMADVAAVAIKGAQLMASLHLSRERERASYMESVARLAAAAEARDGTTGRHLQHLESSVRLLAEGLDQNREFVSEVVVASQMHDVGKISVPDSILLKPGPLTLLEREIVNRHTVDGEHLLTGQMLHVAREVARSHHERWDGRGYPDGLTGEEIPFTARIVAVADVYDALISERPYKRAWPEDQAYEQICSEAGTHFDVQVVEVFKKLWNQGVFRTETAAGAR